MCTSMYSVFALWVHFPSMYAAVHLMFLFRIITIRCTRANLYRWHFHKALQHDVWLTILYRTYSDNDSNDDDDGGGGGGETISIYFPPDFSHIDGNTYDTFCARLTLFTACSAAGAREEAREREQFEGKLEERNTLIL